MSVELIRYFMARLAAKGRQRIIVTGDPMLDCWWHGKMNRVSPEGGHPIFLKSGKVTVTPGGAANTAWQLKYIGEEILLAPLCNELFQFDLANFGSQVDAIPVKTRMIDETGRTCWRFDDDTFKMRDENAIRSHLASQFQQLQKRWLHGACERPGVILVSDYNKGWYRDEMLDGVEGVPIIVDVKPPRELCYYGNATVMKMNRKEWDHYDTLLEHIAPPSELEWVIVTNAAEPPSVMSFGDLHEHRRTDSVPLVEPKFIAGAGDCFMAWLGAATSLGFTIHDAATIAHLAGMAYTLKGSPVHPQEVLRLVDPVGGKIVDAKSLPDLLPTDGVMVTNGVFRLLHAGHVRFLQWAKRQGKCLVVAVNKDRRPGGFATFDEAAHVIAGLECVDWVVGFDGEDPMELYESWPFCNRATLAKGPDYLDKIPVGVGSFANWMIAPVNEFDKHATDIIGK